MISPTLLPCSCDGSQRGGYSVFAGGYVPYDGESGSTGGISWFLREDQQRLEDRGVTGQHSHRPSTRLRMLTFLLEYRMLAVMALWNASWTPDPDLEEHSTYASAPTDLARARPSDGRMCPECPASRRSDCVPTNTTGECLVIARIFGIQKLSTLFIESSSTRLKHTMKMSEVEMEDKSSCWKTKKITWR